MQRDEQHPGVRLKDVLRAVAMVHVIVHNGNALRSGRRAQGLKGARLKGYGKIQGRCIWDGPGLHAKQYALQRENRKLRAGHNSKVERPLRVDGCN